MNDDFEDSLRETLGQAVPQPPAGVDRAARARGYARRLRRTRAVTAIVAVAVVAAAAIIVPSVLASPNPGVGPGSAQQPIAGGPPGPTRVVCIQTQAGSNDPGSAGATVPLGAVSVHMCPVDSTGVQWSAPTAVLFTDVAGLTAQVNALPRQTVQHCPKTPSIPLHYSLTFGYADGRTASVIATAGGCDLVRRGPLRRHGGTALLQDFLARLHDQAALGSPSNRVPGRVECPIGIGPVRTVLADGRPPGWTSVQACVSIFPGGTNPTSAGTLSTAQVTELNNDLAENATREQVLSQASQGCLGSAGPASTLSFVGTDAEGDALTLEASCGLFSFFDRDGLWYWTPSASTMTMLLGVMKPVPAPKGQISGRLQAVGGPAPGLPRPIPGTITLAGPDGTQQITVGDDGRFSLNLSPGRYRIVGYSPWYNDGTAACNPIHPSVAVQSGQTALVDVLCQEN